VIRKPVVAGQFYPSNKSSLLRQIEQFVNEDAEKIEAKGILMPHAGYIYSGLVAGQTISSIVPKETFIILGPNHTGYGEHFSIMSQGSWQTPLGKVDIDSDLATAIMQESNFLKEDQKAHMYEHSIEVELPFLQYFSKDFKFIPIVLFPAELKTYKQIADGIVKAIEKIGKTDNITIIASSDMTHYEPQKEAQTKDKQALDTILELDEDGLLKKIKDLNISMCGYAAVIIMLATAKLLGAKNARLIKYQTSADISGDYSAVVGYAGVIIY
jgi:hypothetical protein